MQDRTLITGASGFVGQHLLKLLDGCVLTPSHADYDLTIQDDVRRMFDDLAPDRIVHLAAQVGGIGANRENPGRFFYANAMMGINLIEEARNRNISKFVQVGTVCAYPKFCDVPFKEDDIWDGYPEETNAPYGIAKKALLVMLQAYRQQYDFNGIYLIPVNLYGPGDNFSLSTSHVIPAMIRKFVEARDRGTEVTLWGTGMASREFLYVGDAARAIVLALENYNGSQPVNLGTGSEITMHQLAEKIKGFTHYEGRVNWDSTKPDGQPRRCLDTSRARDLFGFEAAIEFDDGLKQTIEWWESQ